MSKCIDCKYCDKEGLCTSNGDEECYGDAYKQGRADADTFLKQWKDDVVESLAKYDAESVEEVYVKGRAYGIDEFVEMLTNDWGLDIILVQSNKGKLKSFIVSNAEQLKEQKQ